MTLQRLETIVGGYGATVVALSGGVDSAVVAAAAARALGSRAVAITAVSPTLPDEEAALAADVARRLGLRHERVDSHELDDPAYRRNAGDRCFWCKTELFALADALRVRLGFDAVADGTLPEDLLGHRPGLAAARERGVRHPLVEAGMPKSAVREVARALDLPVWDRPSFACLGSRFPKGTEVTPDKVGRVGRAERAVRALGFGQVRVRWHEVGPDLLARIELTPVDAARLADDTVRKAVDAACRDEGFRWVTVDLLGYGSAPPIS
jgi:uncharacterized protein